MAMKTAILIAIVALTLGSCGAGSSTGSDDEGDAATPTSVAPPDLTHGKDVFAGTCVACHGADARGVPSLGKDLTTSTFADGLTDQELVSFIIEGRPADDPLNTTGVDMLPRGGNSGLSDQDLFDVVAYLKTL
jgi:mono/diheme cytochrome c family protein